MFYHVGLVIADHLPEWHAKGCGWFYLKVVEERSIGENKGWGVIVSSIFGEGVNAGCGDNK